MFGLFVNTYDYYEWSDLVCVAETEEALVKYYNENRKDYDLLPSKDRAALRDQETCHYSIDRVLVVE